MRDKPRQRLSIGQKGRISHFMLDIFSDAILQNLVQYHVSGGDPFSFKAVVQKTNLKLGLLLNNFLPRFMK